MKDDLDALRKVAWNVPGDIATNLFFRPVSIRITRSLSRTATTPNQITALLFTLRIIASTLFIFAQYWLSVAAALLLYLAQVLDCVDGELARAKRLSSNRGGLTDYFLDRLSDFVLYLSIAFGLYLTTNQIEAIPVALFVIASNSFMTDIGQKIDYLKRDLKIKFSHSWKSYLTYGGPTSVLILLVTAILHVILVGLLIIGVSSFIFTIGRFAEAFVGLGHSTPAP